MFKIGDKVRIRKGEEGYLFKQGDEFTVLSVNESGGTIVINHPQYRESHQIFLANSFKLVKEEKKEQKEQEQKMQHAVVDMQATGAMGFENARTLRLRIIEETGLTPDKVRLDTRSWDNEGRFAAIVADGERLVNCKRVGEYLAKKNPIECIPFHVSNFLNGEKAYQFKVGGDMLISKHNESTRMSQYWFSKGAIEKCHGLVEHDGKTYRLGEVKFVPFVPLYKLDNRQGGTLDNGKK